MGIPTQVSVIGMPFGALPTPPYSIQVSSAPTPESPDSPPIVHQVFDERQCQWTQTHDPTASSTDGIWPFIVYYRYNSPSAENERVALLQPRDRELIAILGSTFLDNDTREGRQLLVIRLLITINL